MVPTCGMQQFKKISYKYHLTFTGICCWREACKDLSEPGVVSTSPLKSGIGWGVSSALCDTELGKVCISGILDCWEVCTLSLYVCSNASQHHACLSRNTAKKCLHGMCHLVQSLQEQDGICSCEFLLKSTMYCVPSFLRIMNPPSFSPSIKSCFVTAGQGRFGSSSQEAWYKIIVPSIPFSSIQVWQYIALLSLW